MTGSLATILTPCPPLPSGEGERRANYVSPLPKGEGIKGVRTERAARARRILLIHHPYPGRGRKRELAPRHAAVHPDGSQDHRALLSGALRDIDAVHQPVLPSQPDRRFAVRLVLPLRHQPDDVDRPGLPAHPVRKRVGPDVLRRVAVARLLHELSNQIRARGAVFGNARADYLAGGGARRVQPKETTVRHDAITLGRGEAHRKTTGAHLV